MLGVLAIVALSLSGRVMMMSRMAHDQRGFMQAYYAAMSGLAQALLHIQKNPDVDGFSSGLWPLRDFANVLQGEYLYSIDDLAGAAKKIRVRAYYPHGPGGGTAPMIFRSLLRAWAIYAAVGKYRIESKEFDLSVIHQ